MKIGEKYGLLVCEAIAEKPNKQSKFNGAYFLFRCDCGNTRVTAGNYVEKGKVTRCSNCARKIYLTLVGKDHPSWCGYEEISGGWWNNIMNNASKRGLLFDITIEQGWKLYESQNRKCTISGVPIYFAKRNATSGRSHKRQRESDEITTASLDRIDSTKGYVSGNLQWVHKSVNFMKNTMSNEEFIKWCETITKHNQPHNDSLI